MLVRNNQVPHKKIMKNSKNKICHRPFNAIPDELIKDIFGHFTPLQLTKTSLVCKKFQRISKSFPYLIKIQNAFFKENTNILTSRLSHQFRCFLENFIDMNHINEAMLEECVSKIKEYILRGAEINSTGINFFQPLVCLYIEILDYMRGGVYDAFVKKKNIFKSLIIFLLENKINLHEVYTGNSRFFRYLANKTILEYVEKFTNIHPEIVAILNEYDQFYSSGAKAALKKI